MLFLIALMFQSPSNRVKCSDPAHLSDGTDL